MQRTPARQVCLSVGPISSAGVICSCADQQGYNLLTGAHLLLQSHACVKEETCCDSDCQLAAPSSGGIVGSLCFANPGQMP